MPVAPSASCAFTIFIWARGSPLTASPKVVLKQHQSEPRTGYPLGPEREVNVASAPIFLYPVQITEVLHCTVLPTGSLKMNHLFFEGKTVKSENVVAVAKRQGLNYLTAFILVLLHVGAVAALFMFSWKALAVAAVLYYIAIGLGISMGYHRLLTHRSYKVPVWLEYFFALCGTLTLEGGPIFWVATHRVHHQFSDQPGDPHSPRDGAFWSHMGWILFGETNHNNTRMMSRY